MRVWGTSPVSPLFLMSLIILLLIDQFPLFFLHLSLTLVLLNHLWECEHYCLKNSWVCGDLCSHLWISKWLCCSAALNTIRNAWTEEDKSHLGRTNHPGHWCRSCHILLWINAATFRPAGSLHCHYRLSKACDDQECCHDQLLSVFGALDQHQPKQKYIPHSWSIVSHVQIFHFSGNTNRMSLLFQNPASAQSDLRPHSVVTPVHQDSKYHDAISTHLLPGCVWTSVYIYSEPIRHCLGIIFPKDYIDK